MVEAIIFDMDGVLIDSHPVHRLAWRKFLATVGKTVTDQELDFILEGRRREEILKHFLGDISAAKLGEYGRHKDLYFEENFREITLIPGVQAFLKALLSSGLRMAIATSASFSRTEGTLRRLGLHTKFAVVVTGDDVSAGKPDPAVYNLAAQRLGVPSDNVIVFEDAPCGIQAARSAGMRCIGVSRNGRADLLRRYGAESVIPDFTNLSVETVVQSVLA